MTHFADHRRSLGHDSVNRLLRRDKLTGQIIWKHVKGDIVASPDGCLVFDDTVLDKGHSHHIELARRQYSGNAHGLVKGIGMFNCLYVNPQTVQYCIVDYCIFDPDGDGDGDGKTKLDHVREMLVQDIASKTLALSQVLFETWYTTKDMMLFVESVGKRYYCPLKSNRQVGDSAGERAYCRVDILDWSASELEHSKTIKIKGFPKEHKVKLFWVEVSTNRTDWIVTNDFAQQSPQGAQDACALRWKIEQFHRELKQLTGVEKCQCRKARIQRNHIACAVPVWIRLPAMARKACTTVYKLKHNMLSGYLRNELRSPSVRMAFANVLIKKEVEDLRVI